jgi:C4-dicarboxylate transporter DctM subunit
VILAIPLFIVAANFMNAGSISDRLTAFCLALVGRLRGGLGHVNVVLSLIFAGMSGSAVADIVGTGKMQIAMMIKDNRYPLGYAAAITAATSVIGPIIPPSIPMVLYSIVSDASIGYLFLGGVVPGLMMTAVMMALNSYMAHRLNVPLEEPVPLREIPRITFRAFPALLMPIILLGGIYGGATTPTEAAAMSAVYAFCIAVFVYKDLTIKMVGRVLLDSANMSAMLLYIITNAVLFSFILTYENIPQALAQWLVETGLGPIGFLVVVNIMLLMAGNIMEPSSIILITAPILFPVAMALGIDPIHFGIMIVVNMEIGMITPPVGLNLYVASGISRLGMTETTIACFPWLLTMLLFLLIITYWPPLTLWLPKTLGMM